MNFYVNDNVNAVDTLEKKFKISFLSFIRLPSRKKLESIFEHTLLLLIFI